MASGNSFGVASEGRDRVLDGVRGLALAMVLAVHCFHFTPDNVVLAVLASLTGSMFVAIDLFFVLSGFLITGILLRSRGQDRYFRNFYARRSLRVFPAYYAVLLMVLLVYPAANPDLRAAEMQQHALPFLVYLQNWYFALYGALPWQGVNHLWSMAIEEQFYLVWPLVVALTPPRHLARLCLAIAAASITLKLVLLGLGASWLKLYMLTPVRLEGLALGGWLAAQWQVHGVRETPPMLRWAGAAATVGLLAMAATSTGHKLFHPAYTAWHAILASVAFTWLLCAAVVAHERALLRRLLGAPVMVFLGRHSYGIYLVHWVIYFQIRDVLRPLLPDWGRNVDTLAVGIVVVAASIALALLLHRWVEAPSLGLKRYFEPGPRKPELPRTLAAPVAARAA